MRFAHKVFRFNFLILSGNQLFCQKPIDMKSLRNLRFSKSHVLALLSVNAGLLNIYAKEGSWLPFILVCSVFGTLLIAGMVSIMLRKGEH